MPWRYQPVTLSDPDGTISFGMITVHFEGDSDLLSNWSEPFSAPGGESLENMIGEMASMWMSAMCWKAVPMDALAVGMEFERSVDQQTRNDLAEFLERGGSFLRPI